MSAEETTEVVERPNVTILTDEPQAEAQQEQVTEETTQEEVTTEEEEVQERDETGKFKPKKSVQDRFDELTKQRHEAQREAAYWRGLAEQKDAKQPKTEDRPAGKPTPDQFEDHSEYVEALTDWKVEQKLGERDQRQAATEKATTWQQRVEAVKAEIPDFETVLAGSRAPMTRAMAEAIQESDIGPKLAIHLAQNPGEAERIAKLSDYSAARELGKLEATLSASKGSAPQPRTTSAPKPPAPIGQGRSTVGDPGKMSQADYEKWRSDQLKQR